MAQLRNLPRRWIILFGAPLALIILEIFHPRGADPFNVVMNNTQLWLLVHLIQLPLFGLVALAVYMLVQDLEGVAATLSRIGMAFFVIFYTALDSVAGIAAGILVSKAQGLSDARQAFVARQVDALSANFNAPLADGGGVIFVITILGGLGWVVGLLAAATALRRSRAPLGAAMLVGVGAVFVAHDVAIAPAALMCLLAGIVWSEMPTFSSRKNVGA